MNVVRLVNSDTCCILHNLTGGYNVHIDNKRIHTMQYLHIFTQYPSRFDTFYLFIYFLFLLIVIWLSFSSEVLF